MEELNEMIKVKSELDGFEIDLIKKAANNSVVLKGLIEDFPNDEVLPIRVNKDALLKIKEYLEHYKDEKPKEIETPLKSSELKECVDEWDYNFIGKEENIEVLENLILAANVLDIKPLLNLLSAKIALKIRGINTPTIRNVFGIKELNDNEEKVFKADVEYIEKEREKGKENEKKY